MRNTFKNNLPLLTLIVLAFLTRFLFLSYPPEVVFDEVHFGKFVSAYFSGEYYFDIHPPLGKLMIAIFCKLAGFRTDFDFKNIGEAFDAKSLFILRFLPAFFGALFVILIYKLILALGLSKKSAFLGGFLILFDNAFLVESKFILVDMFLIFFGFLSLFFWIKGGALRLGNLQDYKVSAHSLIKRSHQSEFRRIINPKKQNLFYFFAGISAALSFGTKWTGLSFLGLIWLYSFFDILKNFKIKELLKKLLFFILIPFLVYLLIFAIHFSLLPKSGPGDAYMSQEFQKTLLNNKALDNVNSLPFFKKFLELNQKMYSYSASLKATHPDSSFWYQWPLMKEPIWYWSKTFDGKMANIYFLGNPLIWWLITFTIPVSLLLWLMNRLPKKNHLVFYFLILGFFANLLPFIFVTRVTFLYHYLPSLTFGILILVFLVEKIHPQPFPKHLLMAFLAMVFLIFLIIAPLTYGFFIPERINQFYLRFIWLLL